MWTVNSLERPWCWKRLKAKGEEGGRGRDGWMASPVQWAWTWANLGDGEGEGGLVCYRPRGLMESTWFSDWKSNFLVTSPATLYMHPEVHLCQLISDSSKLVCFLISEPLTFSWHILEYLDPCLPAILLFRIQLHCHPFSKTLSGGFTGSLCRLLGFITASLHTSV